MEHAAATWIGHSSYVAVLLLLLACGLGAPLSEEVIAVLGGVVIGHQAHRGLTSLWLMIGVAYVGQVAGDLIIFFMGRKLGPKAAEKRRFQRLLTKERVAWLQRHFARHGLGTVFMVRFIPGVRAPGYLMAGMAGQRPAKFVLADSFAAAITAPALVYLGYHFGAHVLHGLAVVTRWVVLAVAVAIIATATALSARRRSRRAAPPSSSWDGGRTRAPSG